MASLALPGVGPVIAAGAIALGLVGAVAGGALGGQLDDVLSKGLPRTSSTSTVTRSERGAPS